MDQNQTVGTTMVSKLDRPEAYAALLEDIAKRWLAHDGLWFQAAEKEYGMEAIQLDAAAWEHFAALEAERIKKLFHLPENVGLPVLGEALGLRLYALLNRQEIIMADETRLIFRMNEYRVQTARQRKSLPDFPCKSVGLVEYASFARVINPRI